MERKPERQVKAERPQHPEDAARTDAHRPRNPTAADDFLEDPHGQPFPQRAQTDLGRQRHAAFKRLLARSSVDGQKFVDATRTRIRRHDARQEAQVESQHLLRGKRQVLPSLPLGVMATA